MLLRIPVGIQGSIINDVYEESRKCSSCENESYFILTRVTKIIGESIGKRSEKQASTFSKFTDEGVYCAVETDFMLSFYMLKERKNDIFAKKYYCFFMVKDTDEYGIVELDNKVFSSEEVSELIAESEEREIVSINRLSAYVRSDKTIVLYGDTIKLPKNVNEYKQYLFENDIDLLEFGNVYLKATTEPYIEITPPDIILVITFFDFILLLILIVRYTINNCKIKIIKRKIAFR